MARTQSPILDALNVDSFYYLSTHAPDLLDAIEKEVAKGLTPHQVMRLISQHVGPERQALAIRAMQAASYIQKTYHTT